MSIEQAIRAYLIDRGITQAFIARKCGWSKQRTNAILTGKQRLKAEDNRRICEAIGVSYDYFYNAAERAAQDSA